METLKLWNEFIGALIEAKKAWVALCEERTKNRNVDHLPVRAQKLLGMVQWRARFEIALPRFVDYWRGYGGLDAMMLELPEEVEGDPDED